jgi:hypothetical protein
MRIDHFLRDYARRRAISEACLDNYRKHLADLATFHGIGLSTKLLTSKIVDEWLAAKLRDGRSPYYVHGMRASVLAIWNEAHKLGIAERPDAMRVRRHDLIIRTWSPEEVAALIAGAREIRGLFEKIGIPRAPYVASAIAATWHAGVRRNDLHLIRYDQLSDDGVFVLVQHKTGRRHVGRVPLTYVRQMSAWSRAPGPIWPRPGVNEVIRGVFCRLVHRVVKQRPGMLRGCWRDIRRSAENSAEELHPGQGHLLAGHERRTFERYYRASQESPAVAPEPLPE